MRSIRRELTTAVALGLAGTPLLAHASGFALIENSASGLGNAYAGAAALPSDAASVWFNPALATRLDRAELTTALHLVKPVADFEDKGSRINPKFTANAIAPGSLTGPNDTTEAMGVVPGLFLVVPIDATRAYALTINAPFGLSSVYSDDWVGRYHGTESHLSTLNIGQVLSWRPVSELSVGFSLDVQYIKAELKQAVDSGAVCFKLASETGNNTLLAQCISNGLTPNQVSRDSHATLSGDDLSIGFGVGLVLDLSDNTTLGLAMRAPIEHTLTGETEYEVDTGLRTLFDSVGLNSVLTTTPVTATASLPGTASLSLSYRATPSLTLLADTTWTGWSSFDELRILDEYGNTVSLTDEAWEDTMRYSLGFNYQSSAALTWRMGVAYDETPIPDESHRTPRIPGNDRTWVAFGIGYQPSRDFSFDIGYAHLFVDQSAIDHTDANTGYTLRGTFDSSVDVLSVQTNWKF